MQEELKRSAKHICYTEGKTIQRAKKNDVGRLVWVCGHCNHEVEPVTDAHLKHGK